jgi:hypothetical protein
MRGHDLPGPYIMLPALGPLATAGRAAGWRTWVCTPRCPWSVSVLGAGDLAR